MLYREIQQRGFSGCERIVRAYVSSLYAAPPREPAGRFETAPGDQLQVAWQGFPKKLRMDNGSEFISVALADWAEEHGIELEFIKLRNPTQNSFVERLNRTYRDEVLNMYVFNTLTEVRDITERWIREYNDERPHDSLGDLTPWEYLAKHNPLENSSLGRH